MSEQEPLQDRILAFVRAVVAAMRLDLTATIEEHRDGPRVNLDGREGDVLLRRKGEALSAIQHIANTIFRDELASGKRILVDCLGFRRDKERELQQMAQFLAERAVETGLDQTLGPLNAYERRIVHLAVAGHPAVTTTSVGDAPMKKVVIAKKKS